MHFVFEEDLLAEVSRKSVVVFNQVVKLVLQSVGVRIRVHDEENQTVKDVNLSHDALIVKPIHLTIKLLIHVRTKSFFIDPLENRRVMAILMLQLWLLSRAVYLASTERLFANLIDLEVVHDVEFVDFLQDISLLHNEVV